MCWSSGTNTSIYTRVGRTILDAVGSPQSRGSLWRCVPGVRFSVVARSLPSSFQPTFSALWASEANSDQWLDDPLSLAISDLQAAHPDCNIIMFIGSCDNLDTSSWPLDMFLSYPELDVIIAPESDEPYLSPQLLTRRSGSTVAYMHVPLAVSPC